MGCAMGPGGRRRAKAWHAIRKNTAQACVAAPPPHDEDAVIEATLHLVPSTFLRRAPCSTAFPSIAHNPIAHNPHACAVHLALSPLSSENCAARRWHTSSMRFTGRLFMSALNSCSRFERKGALQVDWQTMW